MVALNQFHSSVKINPFRYHFQISSTCPLPSTRNQDCITHGWIYSVQETLPFFKRNFTVHILGFLAILSDTVYFFLVLQAFVRSVFTVFLEGKLCPLNDELFSSLLTWGC